MYEDKRLVKSVLKDIDEYIAFWEKNKGGRPKHYHVFKKHFKKVVNYLGKEEYREVKLIRL